jgi:hypothetical protein
MDLRSLFAVVVVEVLVAIITAFGLPLAKRRGRAQAAAYRTSPDSRVLRLND